MVNPVAATGWRGDPGASGAQLSGAPVVSNVATPLGNRQIGGVGVAAHVVPPQTNGVPGQRAQRAYGNPDVSTVPRWGPLASPYGGATGDQVPQFGRPRVLGVGQETSWRGGADFSNDKLITRDRHGIMKTGTERGGGRGSGLTDPPMDGPPRPALAMVQRSINWQEGNPLAHEDHLPGENRGYTSVPGQEPTDAAPGGQWTRGHRVYDRGSQFVGEQGTGWSPVYGGVPGLWQPYGSYAGVTNGPVTGIQSPAAEGTPGDGPQKVWSGPPHGLHSKTYPDYMTTLGRYMAIPQMRSPRIDRPSNSTAGGQSYSEFVQPQGQTGTAATAFSNPGITPAKPGIQSQAIPGGGWRGIIPGQQ